MGLYVASIPGTRPAIPALGLARGLHQPRPDGRSLNGKHEVTNMPWETPSITEIDWNAELDADAAGDREEDEHLPEPEQIED